jgi:hypothetical protein
LFDPTRAAAYPAGTLQRDPSPQPDHHRASPATLAWCLGLLLGAVVFTRLPFLIDWRLPLAFPDTATYLWPVQDLEGQAAPSFDLRTPGYPLFWWACRRVTGSILFVIYAQMAISAGVAAAAVILIWKFSPALVVPVTAALAVFVSGNAHLMWDVTLLSESIFTSAILAWTLFMYLSLVAPRPVFLLLTSLAAAAAISLRPSAIHLVGIMALLAIWMHRGRFGRVWIAAWLTPVLAVVIGTILYNRATIGVTALSGGSTWAYLWSTTLYLDPDPRLLPQINEAAAAKNAALPPADKGAIYSGTSLRGFRDALERNIGTGIGQIADRLTGWPARSGWKYMHYRHELRRAVAIAIEQHPRLYFLNLIGTFVDCFRFIAVPHPNYYTAFPAATLFRDAFLAPPFYVRNLEGYYNPPRPPQFRVVQEGTGVPTVLGTESRLAGLYGPFSDWRSRLFENAFWSWTVPVSSVPLFLLMAVRRGAPAGGIAWLACLAAAAGNALMAALIGHTEPRYAQPMHFVNYLAVALLPPFVAALRSRS